MDIINLIIGILLLIGGIIWFLYEQDHYKEVKKEEHVRKSFYVNIFLGAIVVIVVGLVMMFREILKLL